MRDAELALKFKADYDKAIIRAAICCYEINQYEKAIEYCDGFLNKKPDDTEVLRLRQKCVNSIKIKEKNLRKKKQLESKKNQVDEELLQQLSIRGINIEGGKG